MGKPSRRGTGHRGLLSLSNLSLCAGMNEYLAKARGVNRHIVWHQWSRSVRWCLAGGWL